MSSGVHGEPSACLEAWRALPAERPANLDKLLRDKFNDIVFEELDETPLRSLAVLPLPSNDVPCLGEVKRLEFAPEQGEVVAAAAGAFGGLAACVVLIPSAQALPRGGVGVEIQDLQAEDGRCSATLRGVTCFRLIDRGIREEPRGAVQVRLLQEVCEWTAFEDSSGEARVLEELERLKLLFSTCGKLQHRTGIWAAGDLYSRSLEERVDDALGNLRGVQLAGLQLAYVTLQGSLQLRAAVMGHAATSALADSKRATLLADPGSALRRLGKLNKFFSLMKELLEKRVV